MLKKKKKAPVDVLKFKSRNTGKRNLLEPGGGGTHL